MNPFYLLVILLLGLVQQSGSEEAPSRDVPGAQPLDSRNFDSSIRDGSVWLIEFYAPWCGHCRKFSMEYEVSVLCAFLENCSSWRVI